MKQKRVIYPINFSQQEYAMLGAVASYAGCTRADVMKRAIKTMFRQIVESQPEGKGVQSANGQS